MKRSLLGLLTLALLAVPKAAVGLCGRPQPRLLRAEYSQSDAVVIAYLVKSQHIDPKDAPDYHLYTFRVEKLFRGSIPSKFVLWDENSSARLAFKVRPGRKYLLFVNHWVKKDWWTGDGCGHSGEASKRVKTLSEIERFSSLANAVITGQVEAAIHAKVVAVRKNGGKQFKTLTRDNGTFTLNVPAGQYSVKVTAEKTSFVTHWLSYEDADAVKLERGGCAQIQFAPSDSPDARSAPNGK